MEKYTFLDLAFEVIEKERKPLSYGNIWRSAQKMDLNKKLASFGKTPDQTIAAQLYTDIKKENSRFYIVSKKPTLFYLTKYKNDKSAQNVDFSETSQEKEKFSERDLHPLLVKYMHEDENLKLYCKTILHERSQKARGKRGKDEWIHPDIVGVHFPFMDDYEDATKELRLALKMQTCKFYSFELKIEINWSNFKECYFQAFSNSSWAHEGYLVFMKIDADDADELLEELRRLNESFGIGVIRLSKDGIEVKFKAKSRELDISALDYLVWLNPDFESFINSVVKDNEINDAQRIVAKNYDEILDDESFEKYCKDKKID